MAGSGSGHYPNGGHGGSPYELPSELNALGQWQFMAVVDGVCLAALPSKSKVQKSACHYQLQYRFRHYHQGVKGMVLVNPTYNSKANYRQRQIFQCGTLRTVLVLKEAY